MRENSSFHVMAETSFLLWYGTGEQKELRLQVGFPEHAQIALDGEDLEGNGDADPDWQCAHRFLGFPGFEAPLTAFGVDSLQALLMTIEMARRRLLDIERNAHCRVLGVDGASIGLPQYLKSV